MKKGNREKRLSPGKGERLLRWKEEKGKSRR